MSSALKHRYSDESTFPASMIILAALSKLVISSNLEASPEFFSSESAGLQSRHSMQTDRNTVVLA
jgi:hypothetical protein